MTHDPKSENREPTRREIRDEIRRLKLIVGHLSKISPAGREWLRSALNDGRSFDGR